MFDLFVSSSAFIRSALVQSHKIVTTSPYSPAAIDSAFFFGILAFKKIYGLPMEQLGIFAAGFKE
jgi:hypothetical protein